MSKDANGPTNGGSKFKVVGGTVIADEKEKTYKILKKLTKIFLTLILVIVPIVLLINEIMRGNWENALIFAIAITIAITAEVMPTAIVNNLVNANIDMPRIRATYDN